MGIHLDNILHNLISVLHDQESGEGVINVLGDAGVVDKRHVNDEVLLPPVDLQTKVLGIACVAQA